MLMKYPYELRDWPKENGDYALSELYRNTDQSKCLVRIRVPLQYPATANYLHGIYSGMIDGKPFDCQALVMDGRIIGKIECTVHEDGYGELDFILRREYTQQGIGTQMIRMYAERVRCLGLCRGLYAIVDVTNTAAGRALISNGFRMGRKFIADVTVYDEGNVRIESRKGVEMIADFASLPDHTAL